MNYIPQFQGVHLFGGGGENFTKGQCLLLLVTALKFSFCRIVEN